MKNRHALSVQPTTTHNLESQTFHSNKKLPTALYHKPSLIQPNKKIAKNKSNAPISIHYILHGYFIRTNSSIQLKLASTSIPGPTSSPSKKQPCSSSGLGEPRVIQNRVARKANPSTPKNAAAARPESFPSTARSATEEAEKGIRGPGRGNARGHYAPAGPLTRKTVAGSACGETTTRLVCASRAAHKSRGDYRRGIARK